jgi:hypothetical protein
MARFAKAGIFASALVFAALATAIAFAQSPDPKEEADKLAPGVYYWTSTAWQPMEPLTWSANGVKRDGKSSVFSYRHPAARVQVAGGSPLFCIKFIETAAGSPSAENVLIARLDQKKDHRQLQTTSDAGAFKFKMALSKDRMPEINVTNVRPGVMLVTPKDPLSPGEYALGSSSLAISGYDFGFHSAK